MFFLIQVRDAKDLFLKLEEKGLLDNSVFLSQLLDTIHRKDLLDLLETDSRNLEETDASPTLSAYRYKQCLQQFSFLFCFWHFSSFSLFCSFSQGDAVQSI